MVQALKEVGADNVTEKEAMTVVKYLKKEPYQDLKHDIKNAPQWIAEIMAQAIK